MSLMKRVPGWGIPTQRLEGKKENGLFTDRELFSSRGQSFGFKGTGSDTGLSGFGYLGGLDVSVPQLSPQFLRISVTCGLLRGSQGVNRSKASGTQQVHTVLF